MAGSTAMESTKLLRSSSDRLYVRLRDLLEARGVDVRTCALATLFPNDADMEYGIVVTDDRRVHEFELHYGRGDLAAQARTARLTSWQDITDGWASNPSASDVDAAMALLNEATPVSWAATEADVERRRAAARRAVGQRLEGVRYYDIDYGLLDRTGLPDGARVIDGPAEWLSPSWLFPTFHSVDFGVELTFDAGAVFSVAWDSPGWHEGLGFHERPMLGTFVSREAATAVWEVAGQTPWESVVGHRVDDVELHYEPWNDDGSFWCRRLAVTVAGERVEFELGEGRLGSTEIHPSPDNIAVTWSTGRVVN